MPVRLQHVAVPRPPASEETARHFYGTLLGLDEIPAPPALSSLAVIWYRLDDASELHLFVEESAGQDRSGHHFCLAVEDVEAVRERLEAAGMTVVGAVPIPGRPRCFVRDPFGNLIELTTIDGA